LALYTALAGANIRNSQFRGPKPDPTTGLYSLDIYAKRISYYQKTGTEPKELAYSIKTYDFLKHRQEALDNNDPAQAAMWLDKALKLKHDYDAETARTMAEFAITHPNPLPPPGPGSFNKCSGLEGSVRECAPAPSEPACRSRSSDGQMICH
jgi:hypothetical protein